MKKIIALSFLVFSFAFAQAQLTLTSGSFPNVGDVFIGHNDSLTSTLTPGPSGASQSWNFAALHNHYLDTTSVVTVASTPNGAAFPTSNLAGVQGAGAGYVYMNKTATECDFIGVSGSMMGSGILNIHYTTPMIVAKSGITYNSNYNFVNSFLLMVSGADVGQSAIDSARIHSDTYVKKVVDGWGTVTSPFGAFPCLRIMEKDSAVQVIDVKIPFVGWQLAFINQTSVNVNYSFVDDSKISPIVQLNMDSTSSTVRNASYRDSWYAGINESVTPSLFTVYPNPNSGTDIHLLVGGLPADRYLIQLFDLSGKQLNSGSYSVNKTTVTDVNWSSLNLADGSYFAVISRRNQILQRLKFEVVK